MSFFILHPSSFILWGAFPRGPGLYFHLGKLLAVLAVYLCWVRTCWWVSRDCKEAGQPGALWNPAFFACGVVGLVAVWALPLFWVSFVALVALYLGPTLLYVSRRNEAVAPEKRVLTPRHLRALANRYLSLRFKEEAPEEKEKAIPVRFIGKSAGAREEDASRVARAEQSPHYRSALERVHAALLKRATDIHLEPTKDEMTVRLRVDGLLHPEEPFPRAKGDALVNIFKVLADLDITEKRKPQDGSFSAEVRGTGEGERQVDFRVATAGSVVGEKLVMRILDQARQVARLPHLGMRDKMREQVRALAAQPHGMLIVCGPTGAGKSTTLYACLAEID